MSLSFTLINAIYFRLKYEVEALLTTFRSSFDNDVTPYFALIICIWGNSKNKIVHFFEDIFIQGVGFPYKQRK